MGVSDELSSQNADFSVLSGRFSPPASYNNMLKDMEVNAMSEKVKVSSLDQVSSGSWYITEEDGKEAGLELNYFVC